MINHNYFFSLHTLYIFARKLGAILRIVNIMSCDTDLLSILMKTAMLVIHLYISQNKLVEDKLENGVAPVTMLVHADGVIEVSHVMLIESQQENRTPVTTLCTDKKYSEICTQYDSLVL